PGPLAHATGTMVARPRAPTRPGGSILLEPAQRHFLDAMAGPLAEDQVGTGPSGQDVGAEIGEVDAIPQATRDRIGLRVGKACITVEIGARVLEGSAAKRLEALDIPCPDQFL